MWRVPAQRIRLDLDPFVEVEPIHAWAIQFEGYQLLAAFMAAENGTPAEYEALAALYTRFVEEAQPQWDICDARGPVPTTARGMMRLPIDLGLSMVSQWVESLIVEKPEDAPLAVVDTVIPPGPANQEIKRVLRAKKKAA